MPPLSLKQQISRYYDLRSLHDRGWSDEQLGTFAGITPAEAREIISGEPPRAPVEPVEPVETPPAVAPKVRRKPKAKG